jgi:hypothetical protein
MNENFLVFVDPIGKNSDGLYLYEFYWSKDPSVVFGEYWNVLPISQVSRIQKYPHESTIDGKKEIRMPILLKVAQNNGCLSMTDVTDNILALAWEDISMMDEYPEYRLILHYGEKMSVIQNKINKKLVYYDKKDE